MDVHVLSTGLTLDRRPHPEGTASSAITGHAYPEIGGSRLIRDGRVVVAADQVLPHLTSVVRPVEADLCRRWYVLALFEECYRMAMRWRSPLDGLAVDAGPSDLLALVPEPAVAELSALMAGAMGSTLGSWGGRLVIANPAFIDSRLVGGADADLVVDGYLVDFKVSNDSFRPHWIYQLIGYALLDSDDRCAIRRVALYHARVATLLDWALDDLIAEAAGNPVGLEDLREEFQEAASMGPAARQGAAWRAGSVRRPPHR